MSCVECDIDLTHGRKLCQTCRASVKVLCACGCGTLINKYYKDHGLFERHWAPEHRQRKYATKDEARKAKAYARRIRARKFKSQLVVELGGACYDCDLAYTGTNACVFDFHHRDPTTKSKNSFCFTVQGMQILRAEAKKCDLLCSNYHRLRHREEY